MAFLKRIIVCKRVKESSNKVKNPTFVQAEHCGWIKNDTSYFCVVLRTRKNSILNGLSETFFLDFLAYCFFSPILHAHCNPCINTSSSQIIMYQEALCWTSIWK